MVTSSTPSAAEKTTAPLPVSPAAGKGHGAAADDAPLQALPIPAQPSAAYAEQLLQVLLQTSSKGAAAISQVLTVEHCHHILTEVQKIVAKEPTLLEIAAAGKKVTVVGDTHGHFQDVCHMLEKFGRPSADRVYVFNGDFVDRGSWGLETLILLLVYKWLFPNNVYLIRGNHESSYCTSYYGFKNELKTKYGKSAGKELYKDVLRLFAKLPLAAVVEGSTLILHGGLFRAPPKKQKGVAQYKNLLAMPQHIRDKLQMGSLDDLRKASKGGVDPDPDVHLSQLIASDVVWSDPSRLPGHEANTLRGVGTRWGADVTEAFLRDNGLKLIIRSHEGPDARFKRPQNDRMGSIDGGYSIDHSTPSGKVVTLFSAPCYPMHQAAGEEPFRNQGSVIHLSLPDYATPDVQHFDAVMPRPPALLFYEPTGNSSDSDTQEVMEDSDVEATSTSSMGVSESAAASDTAASSGPTASGSILSDGRRRSGRVASSRVSAAPAVVSTGATSRQSGRVAAAVFGPLAADNSLAHAPVAGTVASQKPRSPKRKRGK